MNDREKLIALLGGNLPHHSNDVAYWQDEHIGALADHLIANGVTIQRWIPVTERLPEDDKRRVLAVCIGDCPIGYPKMDTDRYVRGHWVRYGNDVTHWMPLPQPPIEEQNRAREENDG